MRLVVTRMVPDIDEGLLQDLLGPIPSLDHTQDQGEQGRCRLAVEARKRPSLPLAHRDNNSASESIDAIPPSPAWFWFLVFIST